MELARHGFGPRGYLLPRIYAKLSKHRPARHSRMRCGRGAFGGIPVMVGRLVGSVRPRGALRAVGCLPVASIGGAMRFAYCALRAGARTPRRRGDGIVGRNCFIAPSRASVAQCVRAAFALGLGAVAALAQPAPAAAQQSITDFAIPTTNSQPSAITAGPDGALWFTESNSNKIGRDHDRGRRHHRIHRADREQPTLRHRGGAGRRAVVHRADRQQDRADHHRGRRHRISPFPLPAAAPRASRRGRTARCGSPSSTATRSGGSPPPAPSPNSPFPRRAACQLPSRRGRTARCGSPKKRQQDRADHHRGCHHRIRHSHGGQRSPRHRSGAGRRAVVHRGSGNKIGRITTAGVITEFTVPTANSCPLGIAAGPDGALWFAEQNANKIGRVAALITEVAVPTASSNPTGIAAGPDGALWFTESDGNNIGRITTAGVITEFAVPTTSSRPLASRRGRTARCGSPSKAATRSGGSPPRASSPRISLFPRRAAAPWASRRGRTARCGSPSSTATRSGGSPPPASSPRIRYSHGQQRPEGIAAGPDGALWFTEQNGNKIGRITTAGRHHRISRFPRPTAVPTASRRGRTARCGSPSTAATRSGGSPPRAPSPNSPFRRPNSNPPASWRGRTARCGSPRYYSRNKIGRITTAGVITEYAIRHVGQPARRHRGGSGRRAVVHRAAAPTRSAASACRPITLSVERRAARGGTVTGGGTSLSGAVIADGDRDGDRPSGSAAGP